MKLVAWSNRIVSESCWLERASCRIGTLEALKLKISGGVTPAGICFRTVCDIAETSASASRPEPASAAHLWNLRKRRRQRVSGPKPDHPGRDPEDRHVRIHDQPEQFAKRYRRLQRSAGQDRQWNCHLYARRGLRA